MRSGLIPQTIACIIVAAVSLAVMIRVLLIVVAARPMMNQQRDVVTVQYMIYQQKNVVMEMYVAAVGIAVVVVVHLLQLIAVTVCHMPAV